MILTTLVAEPIPIDKVWCLPLRLRKGKLEYIWTPKPPYYDYVNSWLSNCGLAGYGRFLPRIFEINLTLISGWGAQACMPRGNANFHLQTLWLLFRLQHSYLPLVLWTVGLLFFSTTIYGKRGTGKPWDKWTGKSFLKEEIWILLSCLHNNV